MRYEPRCRCAGYTFTYSEDQALTPYSPQTGLRLRRPNNDADVNGDSIDNGVEGSAVRAGLVLSHKAMKNFSALHRC